MIKGGIDINSQDKHGHSAIHISAQYGRNKVADLLVKAKADLNLRDNDGQTPFQMAKIPKYEENFEKVLKDNGLKVNDGFVEIDNDALFYAIEEGKVVKLKGKIKNKKYEM